MARNRFGPETAYERHVISSALPVFANELTVAVPAIAADGAQGASMSGTFADVLIDAQAAAEGGDVQTAAVGAPKVATALVSEEWQDEAGQATDEQDAPVEVAALAYALVSAIPMQASAVPQNTQVEPASETGQTDIVAVQVDRTSSPLPVDFGATTDVVTTSIESLAIPSADTPGDEGPLFHSRDTRETSPSAEPDDTVAEFVLDEKPFPASGEPLSYIEAPARQPIPSMKPEHAKGLAPIKASESDEAVAFADVPATNERSAVPETAIQSDKSTTVVNDTERTPIVLEARIVPKPNTAVRSESTHEASAASVDVTSTKDAIKPVQDSTETSLGDSDDDRENTQRAESAERTHTPALRPEALIAEPSISRVSTPRAAPHEPVRHTPVVIEERLDPVSPPTPLKHLDIRIPDANGGVTVRVHEQAGAVQVSVRTSDAQIAGNIAENLPDLTRQLDHQGFHAETWTPSKETSFLSERSLDANSQPGALQSQQVHTEPAQEDSHNQDHQQRPEWEDQPRRRSKTVTIEDFKEHLS